MSSIKQFPCLLRLQTINENTELKKEIEELMKLDNARLALELLIENVLDIWIPEELRDEDDELCEDLYATITPEQLIEATQRYATYCCRKTDGHARFAIKGEDGKTYWCRKGDQSSDIYEPKLPSIPNKEIEELKEENKKLTDELEFTGLTHRLIENRFDPNGWSQWEKEHIDEFIDYNVNVCGYTMSEEHKQRLYEEFVVEDEEDDE